MTERQRNRTYASSNYLFKPQQERRENMEKLDCSFVQKHWGYIEEQRMEMLQVI